MGKVKHIISLGAGVQSSTMALMAAHGEITPMPDAAIFADTGSEPSAVYRQLEYLESHRPFAVHRVSAGNLYEDILAESKRASWGRPPFFVVNDRGRAGQIRRQCTGDYKLDPIRKEVRRMLNLTARRSPRTAVVSQWIGISLDEIVRMKDSREPWVENRWPLIELRMNRRDCLAWLERNGHPRPAKSACVFCPYRDNSGWREMKSADPAAFQQAVKIDDFIRENMPGVNKSRAFVHSSLQPLRDIDFSSLEDCGQINMFNNECEGMCGV